MNTSKYQGQKAISYARASMGKGRGQDDSTDRQLDQARDYCERMGMVLDEDLLIDEGVSGFKTVRQGDKFVAKNLSHESALAQFAEAVRNGAFPDGVNLIVEKLDRVYRDKPRRAMMHFLNLLDGGVTIHTLLDGATIYDPEAENDQEQLLIAVVRLCASHEYSKALSQRQILSRKRRIEKMRTGEVEWSSMNRYPRWIDITKDESGEFQASISSSNKLVMNSIFDMWIDERMSCEKIAMKLNKEGILGFNGHTWEKGTIQHIIRNESVTGLITHQTDTENLEEYKKHYPHLQVIDDAKWQLSKRGGKGKGRGRRSEDNHIFEDIIFCGYCQSEYRRKKETIFKDSTLYYEGTKGFKGMRKQAKIEVEHPEKQYRCKNTGNCTSNHIDYFKFYDTFFAWVKEVDITQIIETSSDKIRVASERRQLELEKDIEEQEQKIARERKMLLQYEDLDDDDLFKDTARRIKEFNDKKKLYQDELNQERSHQSNLAKVKEVAEDDQKKIMEFLEKCHDNHEWYAFENLRSTEEKKRQSGLGTTPLMKEIDDAWDAQIRINSSLKSEVNPKDEKIVEDFRNKYLKDAIEKDQQAVSNKMALNSLLKKYIKSIHICGHGFPSHKATRPYHPTKEGFRRADEPSCYQTHRNELSEFCQSAGLEHKRFELSDEQKKKKLLSRKEYGEIFGVRDREITRYWKDYGCPKPSIDGATHEDMIEWVKEYNQKIKNDGKHLGSDKHDDRRYQKFFSFKVEFTDLCKKDTTKFVCPHHEDPKSGVSFTYSTHSGLAQWEGSFGEKEIKIMRNPNEIGIKSDINKTDDCIFMEDDPILLGQFRFQTMFLRTNYKPKREAGSDVTRKEFAELRKRMKGLSKAEQKKMFHESGILNKFEVLFLNYKSFFNFHYVENEDTKKLDEAFETVSKLKKWIESE
jgi:hypothetical protein